MTTAANVQCPYVRRFVLGVGFALLACRAGPTDGRVPSPRIVSLLPNVTEILFEIGMGDHLVGATRYCTRPEAARSIPRVGGILDVSFEAVVGARPDLVIGSPNVLRGHLRETLDQMGVRVVTLTFETFEDLLSGVTAIGAAIQRPEAARALRESMERDLDRLEDLLRRDPALRVLWVVGRSPLVVAGPTSFLGTLMDRMGVVNVVPAGPVAYPTWSLEQVLRADPDLIVDGANESSDLAAVLASARVRAAREGRVVRIPDEAVIRPGPATARAAIALAGAIRRALESR